MLHVRWYLKKTPTHLHPCSKRINRGFPTTDWLCIPLDPWICSYLTFYDVHDDVGRLLQLENIAQLLYIL